MPSSPSALRAKFNQAISHDHLRGICMALWAAYPETQKFVGEHFNNRQGHGVRGHLRRSIADRNLAAYGRRIPGAQVLWESNEPGTSYHTVIAVNGIRLTQSNAASPQHVIQHADFRQGYAESAQMNWLDGPKPKRTDSKLYAMIVHGASSNPKQPGFMSVVFPTNDCTDYVHEATIGILAMFDDLATAIRNDNIEMIPDELMIDLRKIDDEDEAASA